MNAEIITIGDEILIGQITDTNSQFIAQELNKIGVSVYQITSIQDDSNHILKALEEAQNRVDIIIMTGGLGPTKDDITKKTLASFLNDTTFVEYPEVIEHIKSLFAKINHPFKEIQRYQAQLPSKATLLNNKFGTAPGMWFLENNKVFISLPGVPYEMKALITDEVIPKLQQQFQLPYIFHTTLMTYGQGESTIAERIEEFENTLPNFIKLAYLPSFGRVRLRLTAKGVDKILIKTKLDEKVVLLKNLLADIFTGIDDDASLEKLIGEILTAKTKTLATAESLTGGKIAATLVAIPGSSAYFKGSVVAYTKEIKTKVLGVSEQDIQKFGTVSASIAQQMAQGVLELYDTDYAIAVTGNAGPTKDANDESLGKVFIAFASKNSIEIFDFDFGQPREKVINRTVSKSLEILLKKIQ